MKFDNIIPEWENTGTEPNDKLKKEGFQSGYKPPANIFNWFWSLVSRCVNELQEKLNNTESSFKSEIDAHIKDKNNPHSVTKAQLELGNVINVEQASKTEFDTHTANKNNPHSVTKAQVGLGNVDNTSDMNKPVSTAVQAKLDNITSNTTNIENNYYGGFSAGRDAVTSGGGAVGKDTYSDFGGAIGDSAYAIQGGAVGDDAKAGDGFSGGQGARVKNNGTEDNPDYINAIQLGSGTNNNAKTLQIYEYQLMNANGIIPTDRLPSIPKTATLVIGSSNSGHSANKVDYLCSGTNDHTTIQNAINALPPVGGKIILLEGTYCISSSISVNRGNVTIEGMGRNATILQTSGSNNIFNITSANCKISDMEIVQTGVSKPVGVGGIIISQSAFRVTVRDVEISGFCYGISTGGSDTIIDSLYAHENSYGIYLTNGGSNSNGFRKIISNCLFMNNDYGIGIEGSYCNIYGNHIIDNNYGIWLANYSTPDYNHIHGNYIIRGTGKATDYTDSQYTIQVSAKAKYNDFSDNYILGKNYVNSGGSTNTFSNNRYE